MQTPVAGLTGQVPGILWPDRPYLENLIAKKRLMKSEGPWRRRNVSSLADLFNIPEEKSGKLYSFIIRKCIHILSGIIFIWLCIRLEKAVFWLGFFISLVIVCDVTRNFFPGWNRLFLKIFKYYLKPAEIQGNVTGATTLWAGLYLIFLLFPESIFLLSGLVMVLADSFAAIAGKMLPLYTFSSSKSLGGSLIFFLTAVVLSREYGNIPLLHSALLSIIWTAVEFGSKSNLENLLVGLGTGVSLLMYFQIF